MPALHRRAAGWFTVQGQAAEAVRHTQAAGDWPDAARLLAEHAFSLTLDGQAQTMQALVRAFPPGPDRPELTPVRAMGDLAQGRLDEAAAHLAVAEAHAETAPPGRQQRRLQVAIASLKLSLARRRGHLAGVFEQVRFLASPVTGQSGEDIARGSDLRAVALMNLGTVEAWSGLPDAERHLREGAVLAGEIGRPDLQVSCLAQLAFASTTGSLASIQRRCHEAIALADLVRLGGGAGRRTRADCAGRHHVVDGRARRGRAVAAAHRAGPADRHRTRYQASRAYRGRHAASRLGRHDQALQEFSAAENLGTQLADSHALASRVTGWVLAAQARLGRPGEARARIAALDDEQASSAEIRNARAVICLAEGDPAGALRQVQHVVDGAAPAIGTVSVVEAQLLAGLAHRELTNQRAANLGS